MVRGREPERLSRDDHSGRQGQCGRYRVGFGLRRGCFVDLDFEGPGPALGPSLLRSRLGRGCGGVFKSLSKSLSRSCVGSPALGLFIVCLSTIEASYHDR